jgi:hypothetical protein
MFSYVQDIGFLPEIKNLLLTLGGPSADGKVTRPIRAVNKNGSPPFRGLFPVPIP